MDEENDDVGAMDSVRERVKQARTEFRQKIAKFKKAYESFVCDKSDLIVIMNIYGEFMKVMLNEHGSNAANTKYLINQTIMSFCQKYSLVFPQ